MAAEQKGRNCSTCPPSKSATAINFELRLGIHQIEVFRVQCQIQYTIWQVVLVGIILCGFIRKSLSFIGGIKYCIFILFIVSKNVTYFVYWKLSLFWADCRSIYFLFRTFWSFDLLQLTTCTCTSFFLWVKDNDCIRKIVPHERY